MEVVDNPGGFAKALAARRAAGRGVGLVPTMGALHAGHRSLVARAAARDGFAAVTIFVNPLQFGERADLDAYPKDLDADLEVAASAGAGLVFCPDAEQMLPGGGLLTSVRVAGLSEPWEGASRPGHFAGVATIVTKLLCLAGPCRAYFGEKDYQQLLVVRRLAADLCLPVEVVGCPTVREPDGLALSSRNVRLTSEQRARATVLHRALCQGAKAAAAGERRPEAVRRVMADVLASEPAVSVDYVAAVDPDTLTVPETLAGAVRLLVAARIGDVRLIDNLGAAVGTAQSDPSDGLPVPALRGA